MKKYFLSAILSLLVATVFTSCGENATQRGLPARFSRGEGAGRRALRLPGPPRMARRVGRGQPKTPEAAASGAFSIRYLVVGSYFPPFILLQFLQSIWHFCWISLGAVSC